MTLTDLHSVTFSAALAAGLSHYGWLVGPTTDPAGQEAALASHSVSPARAAVLTIHVTSGPLFAGSWPAADLGPSLESRLRARMDVHGSPEYVLTWRQWDMDSGPPICALRASARRTSGSGFGGWPTPQRHDEKGAKTPEQITTMRAKGHGVCNLNETAHLAGWTTPCAHDETGQKVKFKQGGTPLSAQAHLSGWPTPRVAMAHGSCKSRVQNPKLAAKECRIEDVAALAGWPTCAARDYRSEEASDEFNEKRWGHPRGKPLSAVALNALTGPAPDGTSAATGSKGASLRLNPFFSAWIQGYSTAWTYAGLKAHFRSRGKLKDEPDC